VIANDYFRHHDRRLLQSYNDSASVCDTLW